MLHLWLGGRHGAGRVKYKEIFWEPNQTNARRSMNNVNYSLLTS